MPSHPPGVQNQAGRVSYPGLDLIRFAAAMSVTLYHLAYWWWLPGVSASSPGPVLVAGVRWGWVGVPIFFVLSGFVIAYSAEGRSVGQFAVSRALRLYPAAWFCAAVTLAVTWSGLGPSAGNFLRSVTLSPIGPWVSGVYWTLAVEISFYLFVAVFLWRGWSLWDLCRVIGGASSAYWLLRATDFVLGGHFRAGFALFEAPLGGLTLLPHGCFFAIGIGLREWSAGRHGRRAPEVAALCTLSGALALAAAGRYYVSSQGGEVWNAVEPPLLWLCGLGLIIASVQWNAAVRTRLGSFGPLVRQVGLATYPLYLIHSEVGHALMLRIMWPSPVLALVVSVTAMVAAAFLISFLESYPRRALKRLLPIGTAARPLAADLP